MDRQEFPGRGASPRSGQTDGTDSLFWLGSSHQAHPVARSPFQFVMGAISVAMLVGLVGLSSRSFNVADERVSATPPAAIVVGYTFFLLMFVTGAAVMGLLASSLRPKRKRKGPEEWRLVPQVLRLHWVWKVMAITLPFALLAGVIIAVYTSGAHTASSSASVPLTLAPPGSVARVIGVHARGAARSAGGTSSPGLWLIATAVSSLIMTASLLAIWRPWEKKEWRGWKHQMLAASLADAVEQGLEDIERIQDPRAAVIATYVRLERILAVHGIGRRPFEAPLEYLARILTDLTANRRAVETLTTLFELARFSHHDIQPASRDRAISALRTIYLDLKRLA